MTVLLGVILCGLLSVVYAVWATRSVLAADQGNARMQEIAGYIREGAQAYLTRQYLNIAIVGAVVFAGTWFLLSGTAAIGFLIGASLGVAVGLLTGRVRIIRMLLNPFMTLLRPIPAIALVPVAIVWFGIGEGSKYFVISYTVFLAVWFNTHHGMEYIPEIYVRASRSLGASRLREFFLVIIPAAAPHILAGIRLGVALAFLSLVAAELSGASSGLGYRLQEARQYIRTDRMFALLIVLGAIGALIDAVAHWIGRRLVHWQQS